MSTCAKLNMNTHKKRYTHNMFEKYTCKHVTKASMHKLTCVQNHMNSRAKAHIQQCKKKEEHMHKVSVL